MRQPPENRTGAPGEIPGVTSPPSSPTPSSPADYVDRLLEATSAWEVADQDRWAIGAREALAPLVMVREVFAPVLTEVGDRWERGELSIVQEHLLTGAVRRQLHTALDEHNRRASGPRIAFTTLSGERHELGCLMLAVLAASEGIQAIYLGPDLPAQEIGRFCASVRVAAVAVSIVTSAGVIDARRQLADLRAAMPAGTHLWVGGREALEMATSDLPAQTSVISSLDEFNELAGKLPQGDRPE
ncbi:MAG: hypothetical protein FJ197_01875 [Gammaproteobacteria bacterium]|nr:hypothetical protein [Gammaproteobacteria bacterium]